ncbi:MAG: hypothetical protein A4E45_01854 [Methanosaeta sp. PtaB.Bin039]|nr:MAG: hypothetical protein A4E45_01854 [Methanosaeta sp. PtaB.Bin039]OPY45172.1 MAG: hypothetical protein A4E47_01160 [Methanosaeta sp. PtaU1.Bin028]HOT06992.1 hypothetical protein [Methanotrichaceae archaeon]HQF16081.1 hypothetical protein [Methanotrichaceae archaeon]HQI90803.1 hypothetical protein [Methanotrichaceae archaeon]
MFGSEKDLVVRSYEEMRQEVEQLCADHLRLKAESSDALNRSDELRNLAVETRPLDPDKAEGLWNESEELRELSRELMRQSVEARMRAAEIKHRLEIHDQIEAVSDVADELWKGAIRARRL